MRMFIRARSVIAFAIVTVVMSTALCSWTTPAFAAAESTKAQIDIAVEDPRPLAKAADGLATQYGYLISYEDPRYTYADDIRDVTAEVRNDHGQHAVGRVPRVLVPAGGMLELRGVDMPVRSDARSAAGVIAALLDVQSGRSNGGQFRLQQTGGRFHIVPAQVRDSTGEPIAQSSILDTPITIPSADRDGMATLQTILAAVQKASGQSVSLGTAPLNLLSGSRIELGADNERARDVLIRALDATGHRVTWNLFFAPDLRIYALNLKTVPDRQPQKQIAPEAQSPSDPAAPAPTGKRRR